MPAEDVPAHATDRLAGRAGRRRDRLVRSLDATGSLAVVGTLLATGVVAGAMQSAAASPADSDTVQLAVAQPSEPFSTPDPRPTVTVYKTVLVTPSPRPAHVAGGTSTTQTSSGGSSGSTWQPTKSAAPVKPAPKPPAAQPKPKPSASSSGS